MKCVTEDLMAGIVTKAQFWDFCPEFCRLVNGSCRKNGTHNMSGVDIFFERKKNV